MTYSEKVKMLNEIFKDIELIDEKDKHAVVAYIRGTADTRERVRLENESKYSTENK